MARSPLSSTRAFVTLRSQCTGTTHSGSRWSGAMAPSSHHRRWGRSKWCWLAADEVNDSDFRMEMTRTLLAAFWLFQVGTIPQADGNVQDDVDRLVWAAEQLKGIWPSQPPPPIPDVARVARHGRPVTPLLFGLLSDDPNLPRDDKRWKVQQQVTLALSRIYSEPPHCGRIYCDGDRAERIGQIK